MACSLGCRPPPPKSLEHAKENQRTQIGREAAQERADREDRHAQHVKPFSTHQVGEPSAHRQNDGVGNQIGRQNPGALIHASGKPAGNVRQ